MATDTIRAGSTIQGGAAPLALADDFWFLSHDSITGALRLHERARDCGLAACLLGELLLAGWIMVDEGLVAAIDRRPPAPADLTAQPPKPSLLDGIWAQIVHEPWQHSVRTWLTVVGQTADQQVIDRLAAAGHLQVQRSRRSLRAEPTSWNVAGIPNMRLRTGVERGRHMSVQDLALLALVEATGLSAPLFDGASPQMRDYHLRLLDHIAHQYPAIADLAGHTKAAVATATLTRGHG